jgi:hypothetical protein
MVFFFCFPGSSFIAPFSSCMYIVVFQELGWVLSDALFLGSVYFFFFRVGFFLEDSSVFFFVDGDFVALLCIVM